MHGDYSIDLRSRKASRIMLDWQPNAWSIDPRSSISWISSNLRLRTPGPSESDPLAALAIRRGERACLTVSSSLRCRIIVSSSRHLHRQRRGRYRDEVDMPATRASIAFRVLLLGKDDGCCDDAGRIYHRGLSVKLRAIDSEPPRSHPGWEEQSILPGQSVHPACRRAFRIPSGPRKMLT